MDITSEHANSLVEKLNNLELSPEEQAVLGQILSHADNETQGFRTPDYLIAVKPVHGFNIGMPPKADFNIGMPPTSDFNIGMPPN